MVIVIYTTRSFVPRTLCWLGSSTPKLLLGNGIEYAVQFVEFLYDIAFRHPVSSWVCLRHLLYDPVKCALLAVLVADHRWGTPIGRDGLLSNAAVAKHNYPKARKTFDDLRSEPYIDNHGKRGISISTASFGDLADILYHECQWDVWQIKSRLHHYEGIDDHDWA